MIKKSNIHKINMAHKLSNKSSIKIYDDLFDIYNMINFNMIDNKSIHTYNRANNKSFDINWKPLTQIFDMDFVDEIFIQYFTDYCNMLKVIKINNSTINIAYESNYLSEKQINDYIYHIINIIRMFDNSFNNDKIYNFVLSPFQKTFSYESLKYHFDRYPYLINIYHKNKNNINNMCPFHINTGVSINHNVIYLYRTDELFKVLFHECIHNFKLDINDHNMTCEKNVVMNVQFKFCERFFVGENEYPLLINEAFTEYLALLMWNYYLCQYNFYFLNNPNNISDVKHLYAHLLQKEYENSVIQCSKLFKYYSITDLHILLHKNNLKQNTNAFSYIFIKHIILTSLIMINSNLFKNILTLMNSEFTEEAIQKYEYILNINDANADIYMQLSAYKLII